MSQTRALYRLQRLDLAIDTQRERVREINAALEQNEALRQLQTQVTDLEGALRYQETRASDLNLEIQTVTDQTAQLTDRLYGGQVSNPKELEDIQKKIAERKRHRVRLEDDLLDSMIQVEDVQTALAAARQELQHVETTWAAEQKKLSGELQRVKLDLKTLKTDRQAAVGEVSAETLELYETLRARKKGHAVAVLENGSCSVCRVGQTDNIIQQVRQNQQWVMCTSCGRILVIL